MDQAMDLRRNGATGFSGRTWLFNPFYYMAGLPALWLGLVAILVAGMIGSISRTHFDGVIDIHTGAPAPFWFFLIVGVADALCMGLVLWVAGMIISKSRVRFIDVIGTQFLARWPTVISAIAALLPGYAAAAGKMAEMDLSFTPSEMVGMGVVVLVTFVMILWMVALMYRAFAVSCNVRGGRAVAVFVVGLLIAEAISKVAVYAMLISTPVAIAAPGAQASVAVKAADSNAKADVLVDEAKELVNGLVAGDMARASSRFDATMKSALPEEGLRGAWGQMTAGKGKFVAIDGVRKQKVMWNDLVFVTCRFEQGSFDVQVTFDGKKQVSGLYFRPAGFKF